jgi:hypothetical protein
VTNSLIAHFGYTGRHLRFLIEIVEYGAFSFRIAGRIRDVSKNLNTNISQLDYLFIRAQFSKSPLT